MSHAVDGPATSLFNALNPRAVSRGRAARQPLPAEMRAALKDAPAGRCVCRGIPFRVPRTPAVASRTPVTFRFTPVAARWFVFLHTADLKPVEFNGDGVISPMRGEGLLAQPAAEYVFIYADGAEERVTIRRRHEIGSHTRRWNEVCVEAVAHRKPHPVRADHEQKARGWGNSQTRVSAADAGRWAYWLWAWRNPRPRAALCGVRIEPRDAAIALGGIAAGDAVRHPLRWDTRRKAVLTLPRGAVFDHELHAGGVLSQLQLDLGQVISATPRRIYPVRTWRGSPHNHLPGVSTQEVLVEYTAHPDARFHLWNGKTIAVASLERNGRAGALQAVPPATQRVRLRVVEGDTSAPVPVRLHVHGTAGEYLAPLDRHRIPNAAWFEDYSVDFAHNGVHYCTYIPGETTLDLSLGAVHIEISKGFEIKPVRMTARITRATKELTVRLERVLPWRANGWVSADTHVHFLSPRSALLEGAGEGVNVVNLLASQWGELMTNVGDFDGATTFGSRESGGDGEHLVRVGTENRQHVLGHISLLGYNGRIIAPMTTGGPDESALGDPVEVLLTEWARQCRRQGGIVVLPHFPNPRLEGAAAIVDGAIDAVEMTSWGSFYNGIDPYSLSDWYRYLNCGYLVPAVGGTDKMNAATAVGCVRTYARVDGPFTYEAWKQAVRAGRTFVTYGPLLECTVEGMEPGSRIAMPAGGGTVDVAWRAASVTVPMTQVELVVNGVVREALSVAPREAAGAWSVRVPHSAWIALRIRGHYPGKPEIITAHSSPFMINVDGSELVAAADALTILDQIEGALAFIDTIATRPDAAAYKRMRMQLVAAHRSLHNRMHAHGMQHVHTPVTDHAEHHH
ncbi:CehA/McbA family metallohydrolase [bacterium]|nr:CehA/McbA family metallohydrolase [bacterium]